MFQLNHQRRLMRFCAFGDGEWIFKWKVGGSESDFHLIDQLFALTCKDYLQRVHHDLKVEQ
jgi:hypothetical protein